MQPQINNRAIFLVGLCMTGVLSGAEHVSFTSGTRTLEASMLNITSPLYSNEVDKTKHG
jgi:hypothetical protein